MTVTRHPGRWSGRRYARSIRGFYPTDVPLTNPGQADVGRNFLGYPALAQIRLNGTPIGWANGEWRGIPLLQTATDITVNIPAVIERYRPGRVVDLGTARGGSALMFHDLARKHRTDARVLSIDIACEWGGYADLLAGIEFYTGDTLAAATISVVSSFLNGVGPKLVSLDDDHGHGHVLAELHAYAPLLEPGDAIVVQDTWDQGFAGHPFSPLTAVAAFLRESPDWRVDTEFLQDVALPCNFVHGVLRRT